MFRLTMGKGFHLTFENGYTISVQWGYGNYCDNRECGIESFKTPAMQIDLKSYTAEIAIWDSGDKWCTELFCDCLEDDVKGYLKANEVANIIAKVASK